MTAGDKGKSEILENEKKYLDEVKKSSCSLFEKINYI